MKYEEFIARWDKRRPTPKGVMVVCPSHDDSPKSPSLSIGRANDGGVLLKCFAGCSSEQIVGSLGLSMKDLFAEEKAKQFSPPKKIGSDLAPTTKPVIEKIYSYENAAGSEVYQAVRMNPKSFRQRHRGPNGEWIWTMEGVVRVLYKLPEVLKAQQVVICEGEKDVENMMGLGFVATCNVGGAGKWMDGYTESLKGKDVILCGDNDEPGRKHMDLVFESIAGVAKTVKVIKLPDTVKDASDYIATFKASGEAKAAFDDLISSAHPHIKGTRLPIYTIAELEADYRRQIRQMEMTSFPLSKWVPSLKRVRPLIPGELAFIIGDTGVGKTGIAQSIARAAQPLPTLMFELELPKELMFERFVSMAAEMTGEEVESTYKSDGQASIADLLDLKYRKLFICPESRLTTSQIEGYIVKSELKIGEKPRVVIIDYIQLMSGGGANRREKISDIAEGLKVMAKATQTIVIVTSQVSRPPMKTDDDDWEPSLHSAKESGSIEASCGLLLGAWRDSKDGALNIRVLKSTKGGAGTFIKCNFDGARMRITERATIQ